MSTEIKVPYTNFPVTVKGLQPDLHRALDNVLDSGRYILGPNLTAFEESVAKLLNIRHVLGVSNGTDALIIGLKAMGIEPGDEVITAPNSFLASASSIALAGATPRFADVGDDMNLDPAALEAAITPRTKAIIPVHLTGRPAKMSAIMAIAQKRGLKVLEDCAQAIGAKLGGQYIGTFGHASGFSCHPLKNLFAYGDSGLLATNDSALHQKLWMSRSHGMPNRDTCDFWSPNCRMDELHAAFLRVNFQHLPAWTEERRRLAFRYNDALRGMVRVPDEAPGEYHVYQTYVIRTEHRDELQQYLKGQQVEALTHYRIPIHLQPAAAPLGYRRGSFPAAEKLADTILSLPLYPGLTEAQQDHAIGAIRSFFRG